MTDPWTAALTAARTAAPLAAILGLWDLLMILGLNPLLTKRQVRPLFEEEIGPRVRVIVREEVGPLVAGIVAEALAKMPKPPTAQEVAGLLPPVPVVPTAQDVGASLRAVLLDAQQQAQEEAAKRGDPMAALRTVFREEMAAALDSLAEEPSAEDAAQVLARRGVDARMSKEALEEQFLAALEQVPGASLVVEEMKEIRPKTYKLYAQKGAKGAELMARDAAKLGIKLPGGMTIGGNANASGVRFI